MKIRILDIKEEGKILRVKTECDYGKDSLGLSIESKESDIDGTPKWQREVKELLENKYANAKKPKDKDYKKFIGKELDLEKIEK